MASSSPASPQASSATPALKDAKSLAQANAKPYPGDSPEYRAAREALLAEEVELRRHLWRVAEQRRALPLGGEAEPYRFLDENGKEVGLADLFGPHDTLVTYFWMYGPQRERPCPMCTSFLGSLDIPLRDLEQRVAVAVLGRSPVSRQLAFARERGWRHLRFFQLVGDQFTTTFKLVDDQGFEYPALTVWVRRGDKVFHFWSAESGGTEDPGQDAHGAPEIAPLWNVLDLTPGGRGSNWYPKLDY
ncbi:DUF899 family protein [Roseateles chitinivorans]|uniref:DUF899 family protein n=1 Tax=Roseateles chitinivorans TaxID=2917965 RepID=UPI003D6792DE